MAAPLPNYLVIGAQKSGTSTLLVRLGSHPQAFCAKELHFFDFDFRFAKGVEWYRAQFAEAAGRRAIGEKSPEYMYLPDAVGRIAEVLPEAKLIAVLRNPIERAYSHYWHMRRKGKENLGFAEAITAEAERIRSDRGSRIRYSYVDRGRYLRQLTVVGEHFPREQLLVLLSEDFHKEPGDMMRLVYRFLDIDEEDGSGSVSAVRANPYREVRYPRIYNAMFRRRLWRFLPGPTARAAARLMMRTATYPPMDPEIRARLVDEFAEENAMLGAWLGRDLSAWNA